VTLVTPDKAGAVKRLQRDLGVPVGTTLPDPSAVTAVIGEPPARRPSSGHHAEHGKSQPRGGRPDRSRRPTKAWKARPPAPRDGSPGEGRHRGTATAGRPAGAGPVGQSGDGRKKKRAGGAWENRETTGRPARSGKPVAGSTSSRRGSGGAGRAGGAKGGHEQRRGAPVGAKRGASSRAGVPAAAGEPTAPTIYSRRMASTSKPVVTIPDGPPPGELLIEDIEIGEGPEAVAGKPVNVHYVGVSWSTGEEFDSSWSRSELFAFPLGRGNVIAGWDQAWPA